jgi:general stress protein YciG
MKSTKTKPTPKAPEKQRRGFRAMDPKLQRKIATMGGRAVSQNTKHMAKIGRIGGANSHKVSNELKRAHAEV